MDRWNSKYIKEVGELREELKLCQETQISISQQCETQIKDMNNRLKKLDKNIKQNNQLIQELKEELSAMNEGIRMILMNYMLDSIERETEK